MILKADRLPILISIRDDAAHKTSVEINWPSFSFGQIWNDELNQGVIMEIVVSSLEEVKRILDGYIQ